MKEPAEAKLYTKLAKASAAISSVEKLGRNQEQKYDYVTDSDVSHVVRRACLDAGVFVGMGEAKRLCPPDEIVSKHGTKGLREYVQCRVDFVDAETGAVHSVTAIGTGQDFGDKAMAKGITSAVKYALLKGLCLPTGDDPEGDEETDRQPAAAAPKPAQPAARPDHHALKKFLVDNVIPAETFARICAEGIKKPGARITELSPVQVETVTRLLKAELAGPGDDLEKALDDDPAAEQR